MFRVQAHPNEDQRLNQIMSEGHSRRVRSRTVWMSVSLVLAAIVVLPALTSAWGSNSTSTSDEGVDRSSEKEPEVTKPDSREESSSTTSELSTSITTESYDRHDPQSAPATDDTSSNSDSQAALDQTSQATGDATSTTEASTTSKPNTSSSSTASQVTTSSTATSTSTDTSTTTVSSTSSTSSSSTTSTTEAGEHRDISARLFVSGGDTVTVGASVSMQLLVEGPGPSPSNCLTVEFGDGQSWSAPCNIAACSNQALAGSAMASESLSFSHHWETAATFKVAINRICGVKYRNVANHPVVVRHADGPNLREMTISVVRPASVWAGTVGGPSSGVSVEILDDRGGNVLSAGVTNGDGIVRLMAPRQRVWVRVFYPGVALDCYGNETWVEADNNSPGYSLLQICDIPG